MMDQQGIAKCWWSDTEMGNEYVIMIQTLEVWIQTGGQIMHTLGEVREDMTHGQTAE